MQPIGIIVHHSACPSINGKGYDWMVLQDGSIIRASERTSPSHLHVCIQGDFNQNITSVSTLEREQWFIGYKLITKLLEVYGLTADDVRPHGEGCPGSFFPWSELVISFHDGYH
jgi:hypothetical protein